MRGHALLRRGPIANHGVIRSHSSLLGPAVGSRALLPNPSVGAMAGTGPEGPLDEWDIRGKRVIVTGSTNGIGRQAAGQGRAQEWRRSKPPLSSCCHVLMGSICLRLPVVSSFQPLHNLACCREAAAQLAARGAHVVLACRNVPLAETVAEDIRQAAAGMLAALPLVLWC
jgi:hypothetical protein